MAGGTTARFDEWSGDAQIENGAVTLSHNEVVTGGRKQALEGAVTFGAPPKARFVAAKSK
jgi:hypothetical protein